MKPHLRIIGDIHGFYGNYLPKAQAASYSLQVGDLGFDYKILSHLDPQHHKVLAGNHDNYTEDETGKFKYMQTPHWLGDYGTYPVPGIGEIFYVRGGFSIDWKYRTPNVDFWQAEELDPEAMEKAIALYTVIKPDFVVTHECPGSIIDPLFGMKQWDGEWLKPSRTAQMLDRMLSSHSPKKWIFGHHHKSRKETIKGTDFRCLTVLGYVDFDDQGKIIELNPGSDDNGDTDAGEAG